MSHTSSRIEEEAVAWVIRLRDASAAEWDSFTLWLEADPAHGAAYEEAALADQELDGLSGLRPATRHLTPPDRQPAFGRRAVLGWAVAAALVGVVGTIGLVGGDDRYPVMTAPGERRAVALADGSRIDLNGATRLILDRDEPRWARLVEGEALFSVVHDDSDPFRVEADGASLIDMGTVFNVKDDGDRLSVAVAEGAVRYESDTEVADLKAGMALLRPAGGEALVMRREAATIGSWRDGRLSYASASYVEVAADLARHLGIAVEASDAVALRQFSGTILLEGEREQVRRRLAALLEVEIDASESGWVLRARDGATP